MKKLKAILIGAGCRGKIYADEMLNNKDKYEIVAVAEPVESKRKYIQKTHNIPDDMCFESWEPLLELGKIADLAVISTMDRMHYCITIKACELKYDILLEKPISVNEEECRLILNAAQKNNVKVVVCTVLRYAPLYMNLKKIIDEGMIGKVISINHEECVGHIHYSHSFVRGNWNNENTSSFMLLQKSCHDIDILQWLTGKDCKKIQSFGSLSYFKEENAPKGSPEYCIDGCPESDKCPYNAVKLYYDDKENEWFRSMCTNEVNPSDEKVLKALRETPYGKCVFKCSNDVVDHQTVNMLMEDDTTITFTMCAFNKGGRFIHVMGTKGEIRASSENDAPIEVYEFESDKKTQISNSGRDGILGGHGGGDSNLIISLYEYLTGSYKGNSIPEINVSVKNHLMVFAAEKSRITGKIIDMEEVLL